MYLCVVEEQEKRDIKKYYSRMMGIKDLVVSLSYHHNEGNHTLDKLTTDFIQAKETYDIWWNEIIEKYNLHAHKLESLNVDFSDGTITVSESQCCSGCEEHLSKL